jgi:16S rRNA (guanine527-N7)-methyltransferase
MTGPALAGGVQVGPVTLDRLELYLRLLEKWNPAINLVSAATLPDAWHRHIIDSLQFLEASPHQSGRWVDLGSGGGFPGLVVAIAAADRRPDLRVTLVEADKRKAEFLRTVSRETEVPVTVLTERIEKLAPQRADVLSARALSPLAQLVAYASVHLGPGGVALFAKGANWQSEVLAARAHWTFDLKEHASMTDPTAVILEIHGIEHG